MTIDEKALEKAEGWYQTAMNHSGGNERTARRCFLDVYLSALPPSPATAEGWKIGDARCDFCDSGVEASWAFCPFCSRVLNHELIAERAPATPAQEV